MKKNTSLLVNRTFGYAVRAIKKIARIILQLGEVTPYVSVHVSTVTDDNKLKDKNIVITGGSKGLGYSMAKKFIAQGANVIITGRNKSDLEKAVTELGKKCKGISCDASDVNNVHAFLLECNKLFSGVIDCLVCNAGVSLHESDYTTVTIEGFDKQFDTNLRGTYFLAKAFLERKLSEGTNNSSLLIISSETSNMAYDIPYGMTKAALNSLVAALSRRGYKEGIRVNAIAPGVTLSEMTASYAKSEDGNLYRRNAANRVFLPEEVAEVAAFILSDASKCISGEVIHTNAGNHHKVFWE